MSSNRVRPRLSYREYHQVRLMDGGIQPDIVAGVDLEAVGIFMGGGLGRAEHPGLGCGGCAGRHFARRTGNDRA